MRETDGGDKIIVEVISCVVSKKHGTVHRKQRVFVSQQGFEFGMHYSLAEKKLKSHGYSYPMLHWTKEDLPTFFKNAYIPALFHY